MLKHRSRSSLIALIGMMFANVTLPPIKPSNTVATRQRTPAFLRSSSSNEDQIILAAESKRERKNKKRKLENESR